MASSLSAVRTESAPGTRPDYGLDAPGTIRAHAIGALLELIVGAALVARGIGLGRWLLAGGAIWMISPIGMVLSSRFGKLRQRDATLAAAALRGDEEVLDVGTGRGLMAIGAAKRLTSGHVVGVDVWRQEDQADNRRERTLENVRIEGVDDRCTIQDGDALDLPFPDASFDVVFANFALHNIAGDAQRRRACREIARVLKPGGRLFDYDMVHTTGPFVRGLADAGLDVRVNGLSWRTFPPGRLIVATRPA